MTHTAAKTLPASIKEKKESLEKSLTEKGVVLKDFDEFGFGANATYNGEEIEEYNYGLGDNMTKLPEDIIKLIDEYNSVSMEVPPFTKMATGGGMENDFFEITSPFNSHDAELFNTIIRDAKDEFPLTDVFTKPTSNGDRMVFNIHKSEIPILINKLREEGTEQSEQWADDIENYKPETEEMGKGGGLESKSTLRANRSPLLKYANFEDNSHINLLKLNPFKAQGLQYKDENKYAISINDKDGQKVFNFKTVEGAENRFNELVSERKAHINLVKEGTTKNYSSDSSVKAGGVADLWKKNDGSVVKFEVKELGVEQYKYGLYLDGALMSGLLSNDDKEVDKKKLEIVKRLELSPIDKMGTGGDAHSFIDDEEKMTDFKEMSKKDFLKSYSYLTEAEYDATAKEVAGKMSTGGEAGTVKYKLHFDKLPSIFIEADSEEKADEKYRTMTGEEAKELGINSMLYEGIDPNRIEKMSTGGGLEMSLDDKVKERFKNLSNQQLIARANSLPDFKWDDEGVELKRRHVESNGAFDYEMRGDKLVIIKDEKVITKKLDGGDIDGDEDLDDFCENKEAEAYEYFDNKGITPRKKDIREYVAMRLSELKNMNYGHALVAVDDFCSVAMGKGGDATATIRKKKMPAIATIESDGKPITTYSVDENERVLNVGTAVIYKYKGKWYKVITWGKHADEHLNGQQELTDITESEIESIHSMNKNGEITEKNIEQLIGRTFEKYSIGVAEPIRVKIKSIRVSDHKFSNRDVFIETSNDMETVMPLVDLYQFVKGGKIVVTGSGQKEPYVIKLIAEEQNVTGDSIGKGGEVNEGVDLFEDYENIPKKVQKVLDKYEEGLIDGDYNALSKEKKELEKIGYTFEYYLDGVGYDLRKIGEIGKVEYAEKHGIGLMATGGSMAKGGEAEAGDLIFFNVEGVPPFKSLKEANAKARELQEKNRNIKYKSHKGGIDEWRVMYGTDAKTWFDTSKEWSAPIHKLLTGGDMETKQHGLGILTESKFKDIKDWAKNNNADFADRLHEFEISFGKNYGKMSNHVEEAMVEYNVPFDLFHARGEKQHRNGGVPNNEDMAAMMNPNEPISKIVREFYTKRFGKPEDNPDKFEVWYWRFWAGTEKDYMDNESFNVYNEVMQQHQPITMRSGGSVNAFAVCTTSIGRTAGTRKRSRWNEEEKENYESCVLHLKDKYGIKYGKGGDLKSLYDTTSRMSDEEVVELYPLYFEGVTITVDEVTPAHRRELAQNIHEEICDVQQMGKGGDANAVKITKDVVTIHPSEPKRVYHEVEGTFNNYSFRAKTDNSYKIGYANYGINNKSVYRLDVWKDDNPQNVVAIYWNKWDRRPTDDKKDGHARNMIVNYLDSISDKRTSQRTNNSMDTGGDMNNDVISWKKGKPESVTLIPYMYYGYNYPNQKVWVDSKHKSPDPLKKMLWGHGEQNTNVSDFKGLFEQEGKSVTIKYHLPPRLTSNQEKEIRAKAIEQFVMEGADKKAFGGVLLGAVLGVAGTIGFQKFNENNQEIKTKIKSEHKASEVPETKKGKYHPQPYSVSLAKYGHLKSIGDYPEQIRWYEPNGEYENRTFEKWDGKKWIDIDSVEFDYYHVSVEDNTGYEYKPSRPKSTDNKKPIHHFALVKPDKMDSGGDIATEIGNENYVAVQESKDGYWTIATTPTTKESAQSQIDLGVPRGTVGKVVTVKDALEHKKVLGRESLSKKSSKIDKMGKGGETKIKQGRGNHKATGSKPTHDWIAEIDFDTPKVKIKKGVWEKTFKLKKGDDDQSKDFKQVNNSKQMNFKIIDDKPLVTIFSFLKTGTTTDDIAINVIKSGSVENFMESN